MATILVIDDDASARTWVSTALQSAGYEVVEAATGREGIALYRLNPVDVVILDMLMPQLNGLYTLLELTGEFRHVKIVAISDANDNPSLLSMARLLGARQSLRKPFGIEELLCAVRYELAH